MSRQRRGLAVAISAQAYHRSPLEPLPAERTSQRRGSSSSIFTACAQGIVMPAASVTWNEDATRSTYACPRSSRNPRSSVQAP